MKTSQLKWEDTSCIVFKSPVAGVRTGTVVGDENTVGDVVEDSCVVVDTARWKRKERKHMTGHS